MCIRDRMAAMLLTFVFLISRHAGLMVSGQNVTAGKKQPVVVLDSGHGLSLIHIFLFGFAGQEDAPSRTVTI